MLRYDAAGDSVMSLDEVARHMEIPAVEVRQAYDGIHRKAKDWSHMRIFYKNQQMRRRYLAYVGLKALFL
ncbi:hypothetical protein H4696_008035 [Amycolatopsis lexingtonensis]|uniref:Uncharacterized protein n=1 Tax=Amycolatopsis lexingtonensis TaxID=218822 RepID=A0ABR9ICN0_9PSEU|nr:hypothetical protein [Amycolatopsis lexingtonensis]